MIGRLHGVVIERDPQRVLIDVQGVGYEVQIPLSTFYQLAETKDPTVLHTHFVIRQDAQSLYGFATTGERELFRLLIKVNGVGPKTALSLLSGLEVADFIQAVSSENKKTLAGIPGVSQRNAEHIIADLRGKLDDYAGNDSPVIDAPDKDISADAELALLSLGYKPKEASKALAKIEMQVDDVETLIRLALKQLMKG